MSAEDAARRLAEIRGVHHADWDEHADDVYFLLDQIDKRDKRLDALTAELAEVNWRIEGLEK